MGALVYVLWSIIAIVLAYIIPYTMLHNVTDWSLYLFWLLLAIVHYIVTLAHVERKYARAMGKG